MSDDSTQDLVLVIGNKAYSSWSLRPWLALRQAGARFREEVIPLRQEDTKGRILSHSPAGKVPVLRHGTVTVWESLAICEYVAELFPQAGLWPAAVTTRAVARAAAHEMHAGFAALRQALPMDLKRNPEPKPLSPEVERDVQRITSLWRSLRDRFGAGGPFLFGGFSIADVMFAPVCTRFRAYQVPLDESCTAYVAAVYALPAMQEWIAAGQAEPWEIRW